MKGKMIMNLKFYLENMNVSSKCSVPNGKHAVTTIGNYMLHEKIIVFDGSTAYVKLAAHYEYIDYDDIPSVIRNLITPADRLSVSSGVIKETIERVKDFPELQVDFEKKSENNKYLIHLNNGVYDILSQKLKPSDLSYGFNYQLNFSYVPKGDRNLDNFNYYIESSIGEENKECLLRVIGAAMSSIRNFKKAVIILGTPDSGKSKILDLIEQAVGKQYVTCKPFDKIGSEKAIASYTGGKKVNLSRDIKLGVIKEDDGFKSVISCEEITGRSLYQNEISVIPKVMCIAASNVFPRFKNADDACLNRLVILKIKGFNGTPDPIFPEKLFAEKDSICSLAIDRLKEFVNSGYDFCMSEESQSLLEQEKAKLHTVESFIDENYEIDPDSFISSVKIYEHYKEWCKDNAIDPTGRNTFYDEVSQFNNDITRNKIWVDEKRINGFKGLKPKSEDNQDWIFNRK